MASKDKTPVETAAPKAQNEAYEVAYLKGDLGVQQVEAPAKSVFPLNRFISGLKQVGGGLLWVGSLWDSGNQARAFWLLRKRR